MRTVLHRAPRMHHRGQDEQFPAEVETPNSGIPGLSFVGGSMFLNGQPYSDYSWSGADDQVVYEGDEVLSFQFIASMNITDPYPHSATPGDVRCLRIAVKVPEPYNGPARFLVNLPGTDTASYRIYLQPQNLNLIDLVFQDTWGGTEYRNPSPGWHLIHLIQKYDPDYGYHINEVYLDGVYVTYTPWDNPDVPAENVIVGLWAGGDVQPLKIQLTSLAAGLGFLTNVLPDPAAEAAAWVFPT